MLQERRCLKEESPEIAGAIDRLFAATANMQRGDTLHWEDFERIIGCGRYESRGKTIWRKFVKRFLESRRIALRAKNGVGLLLQLAKSQAVSPDRQRKATRQIKFTKRDVSAVPPEELSDHMRNVQGQLADFLDKQEKNFSRSLRDARKVDHVCYDMPSRKPTA